MARVWVVVVVAAFAVALVGCPGPGPQPPEKTGKVEVRVPTAETPKPAVETPKPAVETPKPAVETPKPVVETPKPAVETPKPAVETPKPAVETPKPAVETPKPAVETPKPAAGLKEIKPGFLAVDLAGACNNDGITEEADRRDADLDEWKQSFPAEELPNAGLFEPKDVQAAFQFPDKGAGKKNNVACTGQTIPLAGKAKALLLLASATDANQEAKLGIEYADGAVEADLKVSDWCGDPKFGEKDGVVCAHRIAAPADGGTNMTKEEKKCRLWVVTVPFDGNRELKAVKLPNNPKIHIFAATLAK